MFSRGRLACSRYIAVLVSAFLRGAAPAWTRLSATRGCAFLRRRERENGRVVVVAASYYYSYCNRVALGRVRLDCSVS
jgi:hypothetical protein